MRCRRTLFLMVLMAGAALPFAAGAQALVADLSNHLVAITTGFAGTDVLLFGAVEGPGDVIVVVRGPDEREVVRYKGRVAGIYVNRKEMAFVRVPSFYQVAASGELDKIASAAERARLEIGSENLRLMPEVERDAATVADFRAALIRNKESQGLWGRNVAKVTSLGARLFRVNMYFPSNVPVGIYQVQVFLFHDGEVRAAQTTPLTISKVGASAEIFDFAHREDAAYGAIAIALALAAGWVASAVFRRV
jgi:uncharacterized protein (TIGR02186 family)